MLSLETGQAVRLGERAGERERQENKAKEGAARTGLARGLWRVLGAGPRGPGE